MSFIIGSILPFLTLGIFIGGMAYRISTWRKRPSPPITLFPAPEATGDRLAELLKDTFLFKRLFNGDLALWFLGITFHVLLLMTFLDHYDRVLAFSGLTSGSIFTIPILSGGPTGIAITLFAAFLFVRRLFLKRAVQVSSFSDYFALILILAVILTGDALRFMSSYDLVATREYFSGLISFSFKPFPENNWFLAHFLLAQVLFIYIPFSKILHFGGIFFTQGALQKH
ncbi:MAG: respiratory nitrate reductase subunit gamma [Planctomycetota bacterium]|jgi:nitrate reductase gamma subunit